MEWRWISSQTEREARDAVFMGKEPRVASIDHLPDSNGLFHQMGSLSRLSRSVGLKLHGQLQLSGV